MGKGVLEEVEALGAVIAAVQALPEAQQRWVFASAMSNLGLGQPAVGQGAAVKQSGPGVSGAPGGATGTSPKEFLKAKSPQSDVQRIACLAYYLNHHRGQQHFKTKDLTILNVEAAGTSIGNPSQAVSNATKQSHYLAPAGGGKKQITAFGEEVVEVLPDQEAVKAVEQNRPKKRKPGRRVSRGAVKGK